MRLIVLLSETQLRKQRSLTPTTDSQWQRLRAQVPLNQGTLRWIFGLSENIRVHVPLVWREEIFQRVARMNSFYAAPTHSQMPRIATHPAAT